MQDEQLIQLFNGIIGIAASTGAGVTAVRVVRDARTNVGKGFAFVEFGSKHGLMMALSQVEEGFKHSVELGFEHCVRGVCP
jgi:RNA recognition motif. (a.k.a. RRM, RBD, or RNP domain)